MVDEACWLGAANDVLLGAIVVMPEEELIAIAELVSEAGAAVADA